MYMHVCVFIKNKDHMQESTVITDIMWEINAWEDLGANLSVVWQNLTLTSKEKKNILHLCLHPQYIKLHMDHNCMHNFQIYEAYIYAPFSLEKGSHRRLKSPKTQDDFHVKWTPKRNFARQFTRWKLHPFFAYFHTQNILLYRKLH